jgi:anti-anti-sigma factor
MSSVSFIDSTALSALMHAYYAARDADRQMTVRTSRPVRRILEITGLADLLSPGDR